MKAIRYTVEQAKAIQQRLEDAVAKPPEQPQSAPKPSKYRNQKTDGYASKREAKRAAELKLLEKAGKINNLQEQVKFVLIPAQYIDHGKCVERECTYTADFTYFAPHNYVVEDAKGMKTEVYKIKRKLMLYVHGIRIHET